MTTISGEFSSLFISPFSLLAGFFFSFWMVKCTLFWPSLLHRSYFHYPKWPLLTHNGEKRYSLINSFIQFQSPFSFLVGGLFCRYSFHLIIFSGCRIFKQKSEKVKREPEQQITFAYLCDYRKGKDLESNVTNDEYHKEIWSALLLFAHFHS